MGALPLARVTTSDVDAEGLADVEGLADWVVAAEDEADVLGAALVVVGLVVDVVGGAELEGGVVPVVVPVEPLLPVEPPVGLGDPDPDPEPVGLGLVEPDPVGLGLGEVTASHFETAALLAAAA